MLYLFIFIICINIFNTNTSKIDNKIIIALTSNYKDIGKTNQIINSILQQNLNDDLYQISLFLSLNEYKHIYDLPDTIKKLVNNHKIIVLFIKEKITDQNRLLIVMKKYKNRTILVVNNKCLLPGGWLEMFINDHKKYPNDAIVGSIQYHFGSNGEIKEFSEGFKGEKFGTFNHVPEMIFNFALINVDLGGILYPKNFFNNSSFYDQGTIFKTLINSEDFWQSAFIIMEDKNLRQSSKIFDYTKYLLNEINFKEYFMNKKKILEKDKLN